MGRIAASTLLLLLAALGATAAGADPALETLVGKPAAVELASGGELRNDIWQHSDLSLLPRVDREEELRAEVRALAPTLGVEVLLYRTTGSDMRTPEARLLMYNLLRGVSTMQGIEYYSESRGRMRTLFAQSYVVSGLAERTPLPDPLVRRIPPVSALTMYQRDLTFGGNVYRSEYRCDGRTIELQTRNLTTMRYLIFPLVQPGGSLNLFVIVPQEDGVLFYGLSSVRSGGFLGLERSKVDSFYNRLKAVYGWFVSGLEKAGY